MGLTEVILFMVAIVGLSSLACFIGHKLTSKFKSEKESQGFYDSRGRE